VDIDDSAMDGSGNGNVLSSINQNGGVDKKGTFCIALQNNYPTASSSISGILKRLEDTHNNELNQRNIKPKTDFRNPRGDWYQWLLAITAWNIRITHQTPNILVKLPDKRAFPFVKLYNNNLYAMLDTLAHDVGLNGVRGYLAAKTSLRDDRRYQPCHEGSLAKALYAHLQTRLWVRDLIGIKIYAVAMEAGEGDIRAMKTIATHSIPSVFSTPLRAVDEVQVVSTLKQAEQLFLEILNW